MSKVSWCRGYITTVAFTSTNSQKVTVSGGATTGKHPVALTPLWFASEAPEKHLSCIRFINACPLACSELTVDVSGIGT